MNINKNAFTLIEIMLWIVIVSLVIVWWFESYTRVWLWKINLMEKSNMQKDSFYFSEKLFQIIKEWWTLDYEEYFNRAIISTTFWSWHYSTETWFWNFWRNWNINTTTYWDGFYYCISKNLTKMSAIWCVTDFNTNLIWTAWATRNLNYTWIRQRYGQYSFQFIDYNINYNNDFWDEDWDLEVIGDDDDEFLWDWPIAFTAWNDLKELYLISWDKKHRTIIRWNVNRDPDAPLAETCSIDWTNNITWDGCRWTLEFLKLEWVDWWFDHNNAVLDWTQNDWVIDTWIIDRQFSWLTNLNTLNSIIAWSNNVNYWKPLFPTWINVTDFKVFPYPNVESKYFWKNSLLSSNISPYVILNFKIKPSWETRKKLKNSWRELNFNTTINLTDIYSK